MRAKFKITKENIKVQFSINRPQIPAVFKINAAGTNWGSIRGNIENQLDLQNALNQKADLNYVENEFTTIDNRLESLEDTIPVLEGEINQKPDRDELSPIAFSGDYNDLSIKPIIGNGTLTLLQNGNFVGDFKANATNNKTWNIDIPTKLSQLENDIADIDVEQVNNAIERHNQSEDAHRYIQGRIVQLDDKYTVVTEMLNSEIANANDRITANANNITTVNNNLTALGQLVNENYDTLNGNILETAEQLSNDLLATSNSLNLAIEQEAMTRESADNNLQSQIDSITASSDVVAIVGTYAELLQYDTATLTLDDIIKVLNDEIHENASSYYRWNGSAWVYIGSEGPFYTKSEANSTFVPQTRTINNKALTNNINLTASDVKALPDTTVIGNGNLTVQKNGVNIANFSANETTNVIANISVPTSVSELTNDANYVTSNQLETGLNAKQDKLTAGTGIEITEENVINSTAVTEWGEIQGELNNQEDLQNALNLKANISSLANVATSGNYNDLSNKPTIPTTTSQLTNNSGFITDANLTPLRTDITSLQNNKQNKLTAGNNIVIENDVISAEVEVQGGEKYGIKGDYSTHYGIEYCQYGLIETTVGSNTVVVKGGMVLVIPGAETKTTIASDISYTIENSTDLTLFYADGEIIEALDVYYSLEEPTNGTEGFIAWFNPEVGLWQFKSNATGNVWRTANATPLADVKYGNGNIVRIDYIGYRILNDDIYALKSDVPDVSEIYTKSETDALLDKKQDVLTPVLPITIQEKIKSNMVGMSYTSGYTGVYSSTGSSYYMSGVSPILTGGSTTFNSTWDENSIKSYIDIPYQIGDIISYGTYTNSSLGSCVYGKTLPNGVFIPIADLAGFVISISDAITITNSTTATMETVTPTKTQIEPTKYPTNQPKSVCLIQLKKAGTGYTFSKINKGSAGNVAYSYVTTVSSNAGRIAEINTVRITPSGESSDGIGITSSNAYPVASIGSYSFDGTLGIDPCDFSTLVNKFDLSDVQVNTYLEVKYDTNTLKVNDNGELESIGGGSIDNSTITENALGEIQAVAVVDSNTSNAIKTWTGTRAEYDAIVNKDATTLYNITDDTDVTLSLLELLYPVGAIYIGTMTNCPLQVLNIGNWILKSTGVVQSINNVAPVIGNGEIGIINSTNSDYSTAPVTSIWQSGASGNPLVLANPSIAAAGVSIAISGDPTKSGIEANISANLLIVNIWERIS